MSVFVLRIQQGVTGIIFHEDGQDLVEYALLSSLLVLAVISFISPVGTAVANVFSNVNTSLT